MDLYKGRYLKVDSFQPTAEALITTRLGSESQGPYASFNLAHHVGDDLKTVLAQRERLRQDIGADCVMFMDQVHSAKVVLVDKKVREESKEQRVPYTIASCDALVCTEPKIAVAVMTADCLPLLLCDTKNKVCAAVHCGWRGVQQDIVAAAVATMAGAGAERETIKAYMGPAIGPQSFEVGAEVRAAFLKQKHEYAAAFTPEEGVKDKFMCDLYCLCRKKLLEQGIEHVDCGNYDTVRQSDVFYSYRKSHVTGRLASVICLRR